MKIRSTKYLLVLALPVFAIASLTGCNRNKFDSKTTIYIEPFSGSGFGFKWIEDLAAKWKEETGYTYDVLVDPSSTVFAGTQLDQIASGISRTDIFFGGEPEYKAGIYKDYFEDLTDILDVKPDGESGKTIREKISNWDTWKNVGAKVVYDKAIGEFKNEGLYMLPYTVTLSGLIFDYDSFEQKGLLIKADNNDTVKSDLTAQGISYHVQGNSLVFDSATIPTNYESGDTIMRAGKDGKYGTYDDGQPVTLSEYETLRNKIAAIGGKPTVYSKQGLYFDASNYALMAQIGGVEQYNALTSFDTYGKELQFYDGTSGVVNWNNGYKAYHGKAIGDASQFIYSNFYATKDYYKTDNYVNEAQGDFINGLLGRSSFCGFINEGNWMETEAAELFNAAHKNGGKAYGEYDLRFLMWPEFEGQKGIDGEGHGTFMSGPEYGAIVVRKQEDADKLAAIKSLLAYILRNESMAKVNVETGLVWGYDYEIPNELKSQMTLFQKNCYEVYHDFENVRILCHRSDKLACPFTYSAKDINNPNTIIPVGKTGQTVASALQAGMSVDTIVTRIHENYTAEKWAEIIQQTKDYLS